MNMLSRAFHLYYDGFRNMKLGKTLWAIILLKLFIMFGVFKFFFFENHLKENFSTDSQRSEHVIENLTNIE